MWTVTDNTDSIVISGGPADYQAPDKAKITVLGIQSSNLVQIYWDETHYVQDLYSNFTIGGVVYGSASLAAAAIAAMLNTGGGGGGSGNWTVNYTDGIVAHAGGGQLNATTLTLPTAPGESKNVVNTCASNGNSVKPAGAAAPGMSMTIVNASGGGHSMNVFPFLGDSFVQDGTNLGANVQFAVADGNVLYLFCYEANVWTIE